MRMNLKTGLLIFLAQAGLFAAEGGSGAAQTWAAPFAVGIGIAIAALGGALAQGMIASAFMHGVSRNPGAKDSMFTPLILSLALVETLVLFTLLVVMVLSGKF